MQVDWTTIFENLEINELFNFNLFQLLAKEPTYTQFNQYITKASETTIVTTKRENKGWFHHRRDILIPLIETRGIILRKYRTIGIGK